MTKDTGELSFENQLQEVWDALNRLSELTARQAREIESLKGRVKKLEAERLPTQPLNR
jgi:hypothetical protein